MYTIIQYYTVYCVYEINCLYAVPKVLLHALLLVSDASPDLKSSDVVELADLSSQQHARTRRSIVNQMLSQQQVAYWSVWGSYLPIEEFQPDARALLWRRRSIHTKRWRKLALRRCHSPSMPLTIPVRTRRTAGPAMTWRMADVTCILTSASVKKATSRFFFKHLQSIRPVIACKYSSFAGIVQSWGRWQALLARDSKQYCLDQLWEGSTTRWYPTLAHGR